MMIALRRRRAGASPAVGDEAWPRAKQAGARFRNERGQTLIEFALVVPLLLTLVFGVIVFGIALNNYLVLTNATGISAQLLAVSRGQTTDPCNTTVQAFYSAAPNLSRTTLSFSYVLNGSSYSGTSCSSGSTTTGAAGNLVAGQSAQLTVTYPCNLKFIGFNPPSGCTLTARVSEVIQ
jgi:Flp pilus assembly protein TadG